LVLQANTQNTEPKDLIEYESKQGAWSFTNSVLQGIVGADKRALCVAGSETDTAYSVQASVNQAAGTKASIIVFYTEDVDFNPRYVECVLDFQANRLHIDLVDAAQRAIVAEKDFSLTKGTAYPVKVIANTYSDGSGYVLFLVNNVVQLRIEELAAIYTAGMAGFACEGTLVTDGATFTDIVVQSLATTVGNVDVTTDLDTIRGRVGLAVTEPSDPDVAKYIGEACEFINDQINGTIDKTNCAQAEAEAIRNLAAIKCFFDVTGASSTGWTANIGIITFSGSPEKIAMINYLWLRVKEFMDRRHVNTVQFKVGAANY